MATGRRREERSLIDNEDDSDDEPLFGQGEGESANGMHSIERVKQEVDTVVDVMRDNIGKVLERGERLENIQDRSETLMEGASAFRSGARRVQRKYWWQAIKLKVLIAAIVLLVVLVVLVPMLYRYFSSSNTR